jgi:hypothetical protein
MLDVEQRSGVTVVRTRDGIAAYLDALRQRTT